MYSYNNSLMISQLQSDNSDIATQVQVVFIKSAPPLPDFNGNTRIELTRSKSNT